jgi:hypothetical protein
MNIPAENYPMLIALLHVWCVVAIAVLADLEDT